jgi:hypothetical protein
MISKTTQTGRFFLWTLRQSSPLRLFPPSKCFEPLFPNKLG